MSTTPKVSVILPTYNRRHLLRRAIDSVLAQTFRDLELIIVDDGSTDGTAELVAEIKDPRIVYLRHERPSGVSRARNAGLRAARGELVAFQDSDDEWLLEKLAQQVALMDRLSDDYALVGGRIIRYIGGPVVTWRWPLIGQGPEVDRDALVAGFIACPPTMLIRRRCLEDVGFFDERMTVSEDWELCLRLGKKYRIAALDEPVVFSFETQNSLQTTPALRRDSLRYALQRHFDLLTRDARVHSDFLYVIAKADFYCGEAVEGRRYAWQAIRRRPANLAAWLVLVGSMLGGGTLRAGIQAYRRIKFRLNLYR